MATNPKIMLVDDDRLVTSALRNLLMLETEFELLVFNDPAEAAREAEGTPVDVVVSDFLMPKMNGVELLGKIRESQPETVRILLTGYADKENAIRAINDVGLYQYREKPWENEDLLLLLKNAVREKGLRAQLSSKVREFNALIERHSKLSDHTEALERDLEMAAEVQRSLLPAALPECEGWRFAAEYQPSAALGGDFYDFARTDGGLIFLLADASGHGAQAALTSMLMRAVFHEVAGDSAAPGEMLVEMNRRLHRFLPGGMYACAGLMLLSDDSVTFANAGLPHPMLLRTQGAVQQLALSGLPLGLFEESMPEAYDCRRVKLAAGDVLIAASDGLGEMRDGAGRFFEDAGMVEVLDGMKGAGAERVLGELLAAADRFRGVERRQDDLTMVGLEKV